MGVQTRGRRALSLVVMVTCVQCQDYPFENRDDAQTDAVQIREVIGSVSKADILFVIDNSASMVDEVNLLYNNVGLFVEELVESKNDYRLGFITPDLECNIPDCSEYSGGPCRDDCTPGATTTSPGCCFNRPDPCMEVDSDLDGIVDTSDCDAGRLRVDGGTVRWFEPPGEGNTEAQIVDIQNTLASLNCNGSGFEAGFETLRRAVVCSLSMADREAFGLLTRDPTDGTTILSDACPDQRVADLNAGFIRNDANLVVVFMSDEDDCSFPDITSYKRIENPNDPDEQRAKLCSPAECYAYHGSDLDENGNGLMDWADRATGDRRFHCNGVQRSVGPPAANPPLPPAVETFLDDLIAAKGGDVTKLNAGAILGGMPGEGTGYTGFRSAGCYLDSLRLENGLPAPGPSAACGCWSDGGEIYCDVTEANGQDADRVPAVGNEATACGGTGTDNEGGCAAMMAGRYVTFMEALASRRSEAGAEPGVLIDSICQVDYADTILELVGIILPDPCYQVGYTNLEPGEVEVILNEQVLDHVTQPTALRGWTRGAEDDEICLVNLGNLEVGDRFEIFLVTSTD